MKFTTTLLLAASAALLAGCTSLESLSGDSYSRESARSAHTVQNATIVSIKEVTIEGTEGAAGGIGGGVLGAAVGSNVGGGNGRLVGAAAGAILGSIAGSAAEHSMTTRTGLEIIVRYENGAQQAIVQEAGKEGLYVGQQVHVFTEANGTTRVRPL